MIRSLPRTLITSNVSGARVTITRITTPTTSCLFGLLAMSLPQATAMSPIRISAIRGYGDLRCVHRRAGILRNERRGLGGDLRLVGYDYSSGTPSNASRTLIYSLSTTSPSTTRMAGRISTPMSPTPTSSSRTREQPLPACRFSAFRGIWRQSQARPSRNISGRRSADMAGLAPATGSAVRAFVHAAACPPRMFRAISPASHGRVPAATITSAREKDTGTGLPAPSACSTCSASPQSLLCAQKLPPVVML